MLGGLLFVFFLKTMRGMFIWWPFHPMGYALALSYAMDYFWFAFMASWLIKLILVRYGGMRVHTAAAPFFPEEQLDARLDEVLAKIAREGRGGLTEEENRILHEASRRARDRRSDRL